MRIQENSQIISGKGILLNYSDFWLKFFVHKVFNALFCFQYSILAYMYIYIYIIYITICLGFPGGASGKESACQCRRRKRCRFNSWGQEAPLEEGMSVHSSILAGESHGQRDLAGYSPWGRFNLRTLALQCCVGFCYTLTRISHRYTYVPSLVNVPPNPYPIPPL